MRKSPLADVFSHWNKAYDDFHTSSLDFYTSVEAALTRRAIPSIAISRINRREAGVLSAKRTYCRVTREDLIFDVCAAPFGTGFFFSWWLAPKKGLPLLYALAVLLLTWLVIKTPVYGFAFSKLGAYFVNKYDVFHRQPYMFTIGLDVVMRLVLYVGLVLLIPRFRVPGAEPSVMGLPLFGRLYEWLFRPITYYRTDTILMFQSMVKRAVEDVIDGLATAKGLRALTEDEKKPIMRDFLTR